MDIVKALTLGVAAGVGVRTVAPEAGGTLAGSMVKTLIATLIILLTAGKRFGAEIVEQVSDLVAEARYEIEAAKAAEAKAAE